MFRQIAHNCLYCANQYLHEIQGCVSNCVQQSGVDPQFAGGILYLTAALAAITFLFSFLFKNDLKRFLGFRLASIGFFASSVFTLGSVFGAPAILRELVWLVPAAGIGSFLVSYFLSFYLLKRNYRAEPLPGMGKNLKNLSAKLKISAPKIFTFKSVEPRAFSVDGFRKAIFLSDNLVSKLGKKDLSAVLLHELYHLKRRSGAWKNFFSACQNLSLRILPLPIDLLEKKEEKEVDEIVAAEHGIDMSVVRKKLWK
ncbi:MAG TPA: M48 family metalloprotease [archaeon]|nr:M48 family metalloprotease [archaeon]